MNLRRELVKLFFLYESIENEFVFGGVVRRDLAVPQNRSFITIRDVKTEFENLRPLGTGIV